jgi:hypothetical protein
VRPAPVAQLNVGGATDPLVPRLGPKGTTGPQSASRQGERGTPKGTGHLSESAAASKAVNRETEALPAFGDNSDPPRRTGKLSSGAAAKT